MIEEIKQDKFTEINQINKQEEEVKMEKFKISDELLEEFKRTKPWTCPYGHIYRLDDGEFFVWGSLDNPIISVHKYVGSYEED